MTLKAVTTQWLIFVLLGLKTVLVMRVKWVTKPIRVLVDISSQPRLKQRSLHLQNVRPRHIINNLIIIKINNNNLLLY